MRFRNALNGGIRRVGRHRAGGVRGRVRPEAGLLVAEAPAARVLGRFVAQVDGPAVTETWTMATSIPKDTQRDFCVVFLMGPAIAPAGELAAAIIEQGRKPWPAGGKMIMVPVNTRTWSAHIPNDAPPVVKSLLTRLKAK